MCKLSMIETDGIRRCDDSGVELIGESEQEFVVRYLRVCTEAYTVGAVKDEVRSQLSYRTEHRMDPEL